MAPATVIIVSDLVTLVLSLGTVLFVSGRAYGEMRNDIRQIRENLAKIEGMFVLRIRSDHVDRE